MNITKGPMLEQFSAMTEVEIKEVVDWVNSYVNKPHLFPSAEETEEKRLESIRKYIAWRIKNSINARIREQIAAEKREAA